jgi:hypothetical protein
MPGETYKKSALSVAMAEILYTDLGTPSGIATLVLFALCFLDVLTTSMILSRGGYEMNPVMVPLVTMPILHILLKWCVVAFITGTAAVAERMVSRAGILMLLVIILWYAFVVIHNAGVLLEASYLL